MYTTPLPIRSSWVGAGVGAGRQTATRVLKAARKFFEEQPFSLTSWATDSGRGSASRSVQLSRACPGRLPQPPGARPQKRRAFGCIDQSPLAFLGALKWARRRGGMARRRSPARKRAYYAKHRLRQLREVCPHLSESSLLTQTLRQLSAAARRAGNGRQAALPGSTQSAAQHLEPARTQVPPSACGSAIASVGPPAVTPAPRERASAGAFSGEENPWVHISKAWGSNTYGL